jgi:hypothetical protein
MNNPQALAPCPFCGGAARIESNRDWHRIYAAHDEDCVFDADDHNLMYPAQPGYLIEIAEVWNRRTAATPAQGDELPPLSEARIRELQQAAPTIMAFARAIEKEIGAACRAGAKQGDERLIALLKEASATLKMWADVAPAVSLIKDIDAALGAARASQPGGK